MTDPIDAGPANRPRDRREAVAACLAGGGETGALIRAHDWAASPLGRPEGWPRSLLTAVGLLLKAPQPFYVAWGPQLVSFYNDAYIPILGDKHPRGIGMPYAALWPEIWDDFRPVLEAALAGHSQYFEDTPFALGGRPGRDRSWFSFSWTALPGDDGRVGGLFCAAVETTDKVLADAALRTSESRLRALNADLERAVLERSQDRSRTWLISPDLLSVLNTDGRFDAVNPAWTVVLGWSDAELVGAAYEGFVHPDDLGASRAVFERVRRGEAVLKFENRYRGTDGNYHWLSWLAVPEAGRFYCRARDVTDEKARTEVLARKTAELDRVWQHSRDLLVVIGADGIFRAVNPAWASILGHEPSELVGRSFLDFIWADDAALTQSGLDSAAANNDLSHFENRYRHRDGSPRWISWHSSTEGDLVYGFGRDITQQREAQAQLAQAKDALRQSQKMEAVGHLTGGIAHDFNNLLAGIGGSLELLNKRVQEGRLDGLERYIALGRGATRRAAALTQRLLAFSRRQTLDPKPTDANRLIAGIEELIRRTVGPSVALEVFAAGGLWTTRVDPSQLESSLLNLCINARDAMLPDGGRLTIDTTNKWLDERAARERELPPGQYVAICVTDTGSGMAPDVIERAFEPFFTTKPLGEGTGLGLSMVYGFVRQSGGQVRIDSQLGNGTTMCLYLPRHLGEPDDAAAAPADDAARSGGRGQTVLVVDDEPTVRVLIAESLGEAGYRVLEADSGPAGLQLLQSPAPVDLLITDVGLPGGMNGRQVADAARIVRSGLKVLFITGYAEKAAVGNGHLEAGMQVMTKPFEMAALKDKVFEMLDE